MIVIQMPALKRQVKRLHPQQKVDFETALRAVMADPLAGDLKTGDLERVRVYKFRMIGQLTLLAYSVAPDASSITLYAVGPHENFYRDLKRS